MKYIDILEQIKKSEDKRVLIRVDFNVPIQNNKIIDDTRIQSHLPLIRELLKIDAQVILISHLGRPRNREIDFSLLPIAKYLKQHLKTDILLLPKPDTNPQKQKVTLIENIRFFPEETENDIKFAEKLSQFGKFYINDAFAVAHRAHASNCALAKLFSPSYKSLGPLFEHEINMLKKVFVSNSEVHVIIGGAKVKDKINLLNHLIDYVSSIYIGGAMAFTFFKALSYPVGKSLVDYDALMDAKEIIEKCKQKNVSLKLPDNIVATKDIQSDEVIPINMQKKDIKTDMYGVDIDQKTILEWEKSLEKATIIVWNGPIGIYEYPPFKKGTQLLAKAISKQENCITIIGGGDSVAAIKELNLSNKFNHVSTGGGATLAFLENPELPTIMAIRELDL